MKKCNLVTRSSAVLVPNLADQTDHVLVVRIVCARFCLFCNKIGDQALSTCFQLGEPRFVIKFSIPCH